MRQPAECDQPTSFTITFGESKDCFNLHKRKHIVQMHNVFLCNHVSRQAPVLSIQISMPLALDRLYSATI